MLTIDGLQIIGFISRGTFGDVFEARIRNTKQKVAVKVLSSAFGGDEDIRQEFVRESRRLVEYQHPNLVDGYGNGLLADGRPWVTMELARGTLNDQLTASRVERCPLNPTWAVDAISGVADALDFLHRNGIAHRDVKATNVLLIDQGPGRRAVKLADLGLAHDVRPRGESWQPRRPSVELHGRRECADDVRALAGLAAQVLTTGAAVAIGRAPEAWGRELPPRMVAVLQCAMCPERSDQSMSAAEFARRLRAAHAHPGDPRLPALGAALRTAGGVFRSEYRRNRGTREQ